MKKLTVLLMCVLCAFIAQAQKTFTLSSPDGKLQTTITTGDKLTYDITCNGTANTCRFSYFNDIG